jgi:glycerol-3-phosphate dehydrogenase (NAD(P)+)
VIGWNRDSRFVQDAITTHALTIAGSTVKLPENFKVTTSLSDLSSAALTIVALPARAWGEVLPSLKAQTIVSATKGVEKTTGTTPLTYARQSLSYSADSLGVISGPSFASDLVAGRPISIVAASTSESLANTIATTLSSTTLRVYTSRDPLGVELGGILKNIIAIIAGISDSLGYGPSARAALIARGLHEMTEIACALGANEKTLTGLSGLGDLIMTATEDQSRNRTVGLRLGKGEKLDDVIATLGATAEGVSSAPLVQTLAKAHGVSAPLTELVVSVMRGEIRPTEMAHALMTRPLRSEF